MNTPTIGQVYNLTALAPGKSLKSGQYEVVGVGDSWGPGHTYISIQANRVGAAKRWFIYIKDWPRYNPVLCPDAEPKSKVTHNIRKNRPVEKVVGAIGMSQRYYNAKHIVFEPCVIVELTPDGKTVVEWVIDGKRSTVSHFSELDPKWLENKVKEFDAIIASTQDSKERVQKLLATVLSPVNPLTTITP